MRQELSRSVDHDPDFEWRGTDVTRIENLSDIVFAIAFGMLIMSGDAPRTFEGLNRFLLSLVPVTFAFIMMMQIWNAHFLFFRRYALADRGVVFLNAALLLLVLVIAYPLRFIFDSLYGFILYQFGYEDYVTDLRVNYRRASIIMGYFTAGYALAGLLIAALYAHALRKAEMLGLTDRERQLTRVTIWIVGMGAAWALLSCILALTTPLGAFAGFFMNATAITSPLIRRRMKPKSRAA
nr:TMEM175 family protein [Parvularcula maris]